MVGNGGGGIFREEDEKKAHSPILDGGGFGFSGEQEAHFNGGFGIGILGIFNVRI